MISREQRAALLSGAGVREGDCDAASALRVALTLARRNRVEQQDDAGVEQPASGCADTRSLDSDKRCRDVVEVSRKRAALASQIACHHFRLVSALEAAADHARSTGNVDELAELEYHHSIVAGLSQQISSGADMAHAQWANLKRARVSE
jgi:hypothetical protein